MFDTLKRIGRRRVPVSVMVAVLALFLMSGALIAATGSATVDFQASTLWAKYIKPVRVSGTAYNWLQIGENSAARRETSGVTLVGNVYESGATFTPRKAWVARLGGAGTQIPLAATGQTAGKCTSWTLNEGHLLQYGVFMVDPSLSAVSRSSGPADIGWLTEAGGVTVYLTGLLTQSDTSIHGMEWTFINEGGTTSFVLYDANGRFQGGTGTTPFAVSTTDRRPEDRGDSITIKAILFPTSVSGWYVMNNHNYD